MNLFSDEQLAIRLIEYRSSGITSRRFLRKTPIRYLASLAILTFGSIDLYAVSHMMSTTSILGWNILFVIGL